MSNENLSLQKIINFDKWQKLQDSLALVTKLAIITVDYKGNPVTQHSSCSKFCEIVRGDEELSKYCKKCDSRGGLEAVRLNEPYIYLCHYNIVDIAIPIIIDGKYIAAIMAGQVRLKDKDEIENLERILSPSKKVIGINDALNLNTYYNQLTVLSYEEVKKIANMLMELSNYLIEEALDKNLIFELYKSTVNNNSHNTVNDLSSYTIKNIENVKRNISNAIVNAYTKSEDYIADKDIFVCDTLKPAIEYIYNNKSENISAEKMAKICHISPSYFSRLFVKETGEKFSIYLSKLKIEWSKDLLENTNMNINEISEELGFAECGYFIKIFKKYEGVTPLLYRKYCKKA